MTFVGRALNLLRGGASSVRVQFQLLLVLVALLFLGALALEHLANEQAARLYRLESRLAFLLLDWDKVVSESAGLLSSNERLPDGFAQWRGQSRQFLAQYESELADIDRLTEGDESLREQTAWVRESITIGVDELASMDRNLSELVDSLSRRPAMALTTFNMLAALPIGGGALTSAETYRLGNVRASVHFFQNMVGPAIGDAQTRFRNMAAGRIDEIGASFQALRIAAVSVTLAILFVFLWRIQALNMTLMRQVRQRTAELDAALADIRRNSETVAEAKRQAAVTSLLVGISHEINTPLGILLTANSRQQECQRQLAERFEAQTVTKAALAEHLRESHSLTELNERNINRIKRMIQQFRSLSAMDKDVLEQETTLSVELVELRRQLNEMGAGDRVVLEWDCRVDRPIMTAPMLLVEALRHLVENIAEFAYPGAERGAARICLDLESDTLVVTVGDHGRGIADHDLPRVMEPFFTTGRQSGHMGLGLNIVHNIVATILRGRMAIRCNQPGVAVELRIPVRLPA